MNTRRLMLVVAISCSSLTALADDWPQWRGPARDGLSQETGFLKSWPAEGPKQLWKVTTVGEGYSTPSIVGDRVYLLGNEGLDDEFVMALSASDGKQLWRQRIGSVGPNEGPQYPGTRSTPTVDGDVLYALGSNGDIACLALSDGNIRWTKNVRSEFGGKPGKWAYSESPLVDGDMLICTPGGASATIVALNKTDGDVIWKSAVPGGDDAAFASANILEVGGVRQVVQMLSGGVVGVDAASGKFLWRYDKTAQGSPANIPTPVLLDSYVYTATGRGGSSVIEINSSGGQFTAEELYFSTKLPNSIGGAVEVAGNLYGTGGQGMICADYMTGDLKWTDRSIGAGAVCFADGLLFLHGENGEVALVEATPESYNEKGRFAPSGQPDRGKAKAWTYPVVANGKLYIRDLNTLWCYDVAAK